jgi:hypothetical protein
MAASKIKAESPDESFSEFEQPKQMNTEKIITVAYILDVFTVFFTGALLFCRAYSGAARETA